MDVTFTSIVGAVEKLAHVPHGDGRFGAGTTTDYLKAQAHHLRGLVATHRLPLGTRPHEVAPEIRLQVYVNYARLLVDCPCGDGVFIDHREEFGACLGCGAIYRAENLIFPTAETLVEVDQECRLLPESRRNFHPAKDHLDDIRRVKRFDRQPLADLKDKFGRPLMGAHLLAGRRGVRLED